MGSELLQVHPEPGADEKRSYGKGTIQELALQLSSETARNATTTLFQARKLAMRFRTWKDLEKFQGNLSIWHVMTLVAVDEKKGSKSSMEELHKRCLKYHWSVDRLKREVQNDRGAKAASGRHPEPVEAATAAIAVKDLFIAARRWTTYHKKCLTGRHPILKQPAARTMIRICFAMCRRPSRGWNRFRRR